MQPCRLCVKTDPHIHVSDNVIAHLATRRFTKVRLKNITNIDWSLPAMRYNGRWYRVTLEFLEEVWPRIREQIARSAPAPVEEQEENAEHDEDRLE